MKHSDIYDKHADNRKVDKPKRKKFVEGRDFEARKRRVSFKNYVRDLEEEFLEDELNATDDPQ